jgi:hypothetical protein
MSAEEKQESATTLDVQRFAFDKEREAKFQELEAKKLAVMQEVEQKKLDLERHKAKWTTISVFVTALSILGSVTIAGLTIVKSQALQNQAADTQFSLKAADLVLQSDDPEVNASKALRFQQLFPGRVPDDWAKNFNWKTHAVENDDMKREVAKVLADHPKQAAQIIATYRALFADDPTEQSFLDRLPQNTNKK